MARLSDFIRSFLVYRYVVSDDGRVERQLAGRYAITDDKLFVLEDHFGLLSELPEGQLADSGRRVLRSLATSAYVQVVEEDAEDHGHADGKIGA